MHTGHQAAKRRCRRADKDVLSSPPYIGLCLLPLLQPIRLCLLSWLKAEDAARLMQASRSLTVALLSGYTFVDHVFTFHTAADVKRSLTLYTRYHMRILRIRLSDRWKEPLVDSESGRPLLPASLLALAIGSQSKYEKRLTLAEAAFNGSDQQRTEEAYDTQAEGEDSEFYRRIRPVHVERYTNAAWNVHEYGDSVGVFNQLMPPGALPHALRFLQLNDRFDQPLQAGSIPDTVEVLQLGWEFDQPLEEGHLPASLTHLVFGQDYNQPLLTSVLPASLRRLHLGSYYDQPIPPGVLPSSLQQLFLGVMYNRPILPGTIPTSVTHLRLSNCLKYPLQFGSIPHGVVHLNLGRLLDHPLLPGLLPTSLRELAVSEDFDQMLQPGSLPDGLEVLAFHPMSKFTYPLQPGVIPATVVAVSMGTDYSAELVAGGIPATVRWLRLPRKYAENDLSSVLSPTTRLVWWNHYELEAPATP